MTTSTLLRLSAAAVLAASCAATARPTPDDARCVVSVEPQMRMLTLASPAGLDGGVTSMFFGTLPAVKEGDLVRLVSAAGQPAPEVRTIEPGAAACADVARAAAGHHGQH